MYDSGATARFTMMTGYERQLPVDNALSNEAVGNMAHRDGVIYIPYLGSKEGEENLWIFIVSYDHKTDSYHGPIAVSDAHTDDDSHHVPYILIDSDGFLHLFYGAHYGYVFYRKSIYPAGTVQTNFVGDIDYWTAETTISNGRRDAYPHPVQSGNGDIYLFTRNDMHYLGYYRMPRETGVWDSVYNVVVDYSDTHDEDPSIYPGGAVFKNGRCHIIFTFWDFYSDLTGNKGRAIGYLYTDDFVNWYEPIPGTSEGRLVGKTNGTGPEKINFDNVGHVVESSDNLTDWPDNGPFYHATGASSLVIDDAGRPYFLFKSWYEFIGEQCGLHLALNTGPPENEWRTVDLMEDIAGEPPPMFRYRQGGHLYLDNDSVHIYYLAPPADPGERHFAAELYRISTDHNFEQWRHNYLTANTAYGAGLTAALDIPNDHGRPLLIQRCRRLFLYDDRDFPYNRFDGGDIRIVRQWYDGSRWHTRQLDRVPDRFGAIDSKIHFGLDCEIPPDDNFDGDNRIYVYFDNDDAGPAPHDVSNIFTLYESFETYPSGGFIRDGDRWNSRDYGIGNLRVISCNDMHALRSTHTSKLWSGSKFLYFKPMTPRGGSEIVHELETPLTSHDLQLNIWAEGGGNYVYLELYDSSSERYIRFGLINGFCMKKSDSAWVVFDKNRTFTKRYHSLLIKIDGGDVDLCGDGESLLENDMYITRCTHIKIGAEYSSGEYFIDDLKIRRHYETPPEPVLGDEESVIFYLD